MSKKIKWLLAILLILLLALFVYVASGPYMAIRGIRSVVASGDYDQLWRFVDFNRLRESIRPQIQQRIAQGVIEHMGPNGASRTVGGVTALIAQPAIDAIVSPLGVATLLRGSALARQAADAADGKHPTQPNDPLQDAKTRFESHNLFTATVLSAEGKPVVIEFSRDGLDWKLSGIRLPEN